MHPCDKWLWFGLRSSLWQQRQVDRFRCEWLSWPAIQHFALSDTFAWASHYFHCLLLLLVGQRSCYCTCTLNVFSPLHCIFYFLNSFYFIFVYSQLTMLWWFQVNREGTLPYTYMYPFSPKLPPIQAATEHWAEFPVLYTRSLLVIHFNYTSIVLTFFKACDSFFY